jgi:hypothetical protein
LLRLLVQLEQLEQLLAALCELSCVRVGGGEADDAESEVAIL